MRHGGASCPGSIRLVASVLDLSPQSFWVSISS
uniref:Uncharacterized protein n=1 Tax=Musa acuminata subsp. malaccensis TaxID=214687 RepID=A0A804K0K4_MUSAM